MTNDLLSTALTAFLHIMSCKTSEKQINFNHCKKWLNRFQRVKWICIHVAMVTLASLQRTQHSSEKDWLVPKPCTVLNDISECVLQYLKQNVNQYDMYIYIEIYMIYTYTMTMTHLSKYIQIFLLSFKPVARSKATRNYTNHNTKIMWIV